MELFGAAVVRGAPHTHVCVDLPYGADVTIESAVRNAMRLIEIGASSVKLEGAKPGVIKALVDAGIPVIGHLGVLPQTAKSFRKVGAEADDKARLLLEAREIRDAGVCAMVLENVEADTAREITLAVDVPTIGIGAGEATTGQVQVLHDVLGLADKSPPFAKPFADLSAAATAAVQEYVKWVRKGK
jgi:3-methyl-2-oxobutanoate hydroxymethyltransferase